ncbi:ATP-binding protein [Stenotrophomonas rhizophila]
MSRTMRRIGSRWLIALVLGCWPWALLAAVLDLPWPRQLGVIDGLPTTGIHAMAEDATGYLWMASSEGLLRFDGRRSRVWGDEHGLHDTTLRALHVDAADRVWVGTVSQGLLMLGGDRRRFERAGTQMPWAVRSGTIHGIAGGGGSTLWVIGSDHRLYMLPALDARWQVVDAAADTVTALAIDHAGRLWVGTSQGLRRFADGRLQRAGTPPAADGPIQAVWPDPQGGIHASNGVRTWREAVGRTSGTAPGAGRPLLRSADGALWTQRGTGLYLTRGTHTQRVPLRPLQGPSTRAVEIDAAVQDRHGDIWFLSRAHGVWRLPARWREFTALPMAGDGLPGIRSHDALAIAGAADGRLWVAGSQGRLQRIDLRTGASSDHLDLPHAGPGAQPVGMAEDPQRRLWIASAGQLTRYDPARGEVRRWSLGWPSTDAALHLQVCPDGTVWLADSRHIQQWSSQGRQQLAQPPDTLGLSASMSRRQLLCSRDGVLWATDRDGLKTWDAPRGRFVAAERTGAAVAAIAEADDGSLWLSRQDALEQHRWDGRALQRLRRFDGAQGYPLLRAEALVVDGQGVVWAGAARGMVRLDPARGGVRVLGSAEGLPVQEILAHRLVRLGTGALAAAVREGGLLLIDPAAVVERGPPPVLVVNAVRVERNGTPVTVRADAANVALASSDRNIQIAVNLLGAGDADRIQHRFRLDGHDPDWVETGPVALRTFARLPPGEHRVEIQARHGEGTWSAPSERLLQVAPGWWETAAGKGVVLMLVTLVVVLLGRLVTCVLRQRAALREARVQRCLAEQASARRTRFLGRLGRRIRIPMTIIAGWSELLLQGPLLPPQQARADSLRRAGLHLVQLVDDALDLASIEAGRLQLDHVAFSPVALLHDLHALMAPVADAKDVRLHWSSHLDPQRWLLGDPRRLRQILLNLVGNALKFTAQGSVEVSVQPGAGGQGLQLVVADTGPGMTAAQVQRLFQRFEQADGAATMARHGGSGLGLAISRELAQAMGGDITVDSRPGLGTRFEVQVPLATTSPPAIAPATDAVTGEAVLVGMSVLLVLPDPDIAEVVAALLRAQGCRVAVGCDDPRAVPGVPDAPWQLLATDPDLRIGDVLAGAWLARRWPGVPRLAFTARADADAERDAMAAGYAAFVRLPLGDAALRAALLQCRAGR